MYIKLFEEFSEQTWSEIESNSFSEKVYGVVQSVYYDKDREEAMAYYIKDRWESFTPTQISKIFVVLSKSGKDYKDESDKVKNIDMVGKKLIIDKKQKYPIHTSFSNGSYEPDKETEYRESWAQSMIIYSLKDEWFYVHDTMGMKFYQCDQFFSLIKCLKHLSSINGRFD